ncbi:hypothetical protein RB195_015289 [Necator americanus]|uniref:Uncharacterized protein n=1 Tax=Necator americanus TaxID=51031 RepID=A0ABR1E3U7_NECAM
MDYTKGELLQYIAEEAISTMKSSRFIIVPIRLKRPGHASKQDCSKIFISKTGSKPGDSKASRKSGSSNTVTSRSSASQVDVSHKLKKDGEKKTKIVEFVIRKKKSNEEIKTDLKSITDEEDPFKKRYREKQEEQLKGKVEQYFSNVGEKEKDLSVYGMDRTQLKKDTEKTQGMTRTTATQALK